MIGLIELQRPTAEYGEPVLIRQLPAPKGLPIYEFYFDNLVAARQWKLPKTLDGFDFKGYGLRQNIQERAQPIFNKIHYLVAQPL